MKEGLCFPTDELNPIFALQHRHNLGKEGNEGANVCVKGLPVVVDVLVVLVLCVLDGSFFNKIKDGPELVTGLWLGHDLAHLLEEELVRAKQEVDERGGFRYVHVSDDLFGHLSQVLPLGFCSPRSSGASARDSSANCVLACNILRSCNSD